MRGSGCRFTFVSLALLLSLACSGKRSQLGRASPVHAGGQAGTVGDVAGRVGSGGFGALGESGGAGEGATASSAGGMAAGSDAGIGNRGGAGAGGGQAEEAGQAGSAATPTSTVCGDGSTEVGEGCDDGNLTRGDGCNEACAVESGWSCAAPGAPCEVVCGDGLLLGVESQAGHCDDFNVRAGDGCSDSCTVEDGWACAGVSPSVCNRSCYGMSGTECQGEDCCASPLVPGGVFAEGLGNNFRARVSSFRLDEFEVTVARFRTFRRQYEAWRAAGKPSAGAGANPNISGTGWLPAWDEHLPLTEAALPDRCSEDSEYTTWTREGNDTVPMNCLSWYRAFAFCIWDGGRLPTESEWEYAAVNGSNDTLYPWGDLPELTGADDETAAYAVYASLGDGSPEELTVQDILPVGSKPAGQGSFGQHDLAGSLWEFTFDTYGTVLPVQATDYANLEEAAERVVKGGSWQTYATGLRGGRRYSYDARFDDAGIGVRCARDP